MNNTGQFPKILNEGEEFQIILDYEGFRAELKSGEKIKTFICFDTTGKSHVVNLYYKDFPEITEKTIMDRIMSMFKF